MNIQTKYNLYERVFFVKSDKVGVGKIEICTGRIERIFCQALRDRNKQDMIDIYYSVSSEGKNEVTNEIREDVLFKSDKEIMMFFKDNIRVFLDEERYRQKQAVEDDDLPF